MALSRSSSRGMMHHGIFIFLEQVEAEMKKKGKGKGLSILSGRALFDYDSTLFEVNPPQLLDGFGIVIVELSKSPF